MLIGRRLRTLALLALAACQSQATKQPKAPAPVLANDALPPEPAPPPAEPREPQQVPNIDSHDILARDTITSPVDVKHVLIGWADLAASYNGNLDPRAAKRSQHEAAQLAQEVAQKLRLDPKQIDDIAKLISEDPGSITNDPYTVASDAPFVPEFKNLSLRLAVDEVGIVTTKYGYHVIVRIAPPPPDPIESADILARPTTAAGAIEVQHILIGWKDVPAAIDPRAKARTKAEADVLAVDLLTKVRKGGKDGKMTALMKQHSEDPGSANSGRQYTVTADSPMVDSFKRLALRLELNEAGLVKSLFGWHIVKRVPPPPPDPLQSTAIMNRKTPAERVKVKHILLGWDAVNGGDERAEKRTRAELEKLVRATVKKLAKKGTEIEPLMAELSEDPGSAKSGEAYEATPTAGLVKPFLDLSLRLKLDEIGVVKTEFGIHIIKRVE